MTEAKIAPVCLSSNVADVPSAYESGEFYTNLYIPRLVFHLVP